MAAHRPSIFIYTAKADPDYLKEICAGIEEEGIFYEISEFAELDLDTLAYEAASESILGSGIGIAGKRIALQMRMLPKGRNVCELHAPTFAQCRSLGANSARAVKKMPFKELYGGRELRTAK
ncbi:MAG: glycerol dehydratase reactivase beta/small subunit family protein [Eubacteriales bacterium]|nr:glycerol dehydratase reactivase beta/small subunit family protein [Eubacteriales bacterium]